MCLRNGSSKKRYDKLVMWRLKHLLIVQGSSYPFFTSWLGLAISVSFYMTVETCKVRVISQFIAPGQVYDLWLTSAFSIYFLYTGSWLFAFDIHAVMWGSLRKRLVLALELDMLRGSLRCPSRPIFAWDVILMVAFTCQKTRPWISHEVMIKSIERPMSATMVYFFLWMLIPLGFDLMGCRRCMILKGPCLNEW